MVVKLYAPPSRAIGQTSAYKKPLVTRGRGVAATTSEPPETPTFFESYPRFYLPTDYDHGSGIPGGSLYPSDWQQWPGWFISVPAGHSAGIFGAYSSLSTDGPAHPSEPSMNAVRNGATIGFPPSILTPKILPNTNFCYGTNFSFFTGEILDGDYLFPVSDLGTSWTFWALTLIVILQQTAT